MLNAILLVGSLAILALIIRCDRYSREVDDLRTKLARREAQIADLMQKSEQLALLADHIVETDLLGPLSYYHGIHNPIRQN